MSATNQFACLLHPPQDGRVEIDYATKGVPAVAGSYVVWSEEQWIRSGKAIDIVKRRREHEQQKGNMLQESRFYRTYSGLRWESLRWYHSLALSSTQASAACAALYMQDKWEKKLNEAKWGGKRTGKERQVDMLCYLSELLDELLMDKQMVVSDSPGFEAPLGVHSTRY